MNEEYVDPRVVLEHYWRRYRGTVIAILLIIAVLWTSQTMLYKVGADSEGVLLRWGKFTQRTEPGLHFKMPWPIDTVYVVPVERVQSLEFGYRTASVGRRTQYATSSDVQKTIARMLTGDLNLAHVEWVVQYRVRNPQEYLFNIGGRQGTSAGANVRDLIADVSEAVMRRVIGDLSVDTVITTGREKIADDARVEIQAMLDRFETGIQVVAVKLQSAAPPDPVKDAFDAVNRAKQSKERVVNEAKGERNRLIPAARGRRDRTIVEAEGYASRVWQTAEGRTNAFLAKLTEYQKAPDITMTRLYLEAMEVVLTQVDNKVVIDESVTGMVPLLHLGMGEPELAPPASAPRGRKGGGR